jgi:hypothetical protein
MTDYLEDVPRGYTDADIEQAAWEDIGNRAAHARSQGICLHGWTGPGATPGSRRCLEDGCTATWASEAAWWADYQDLAAEYL